MTEETTDIIELAREIVDLIADKKGEEIVLLDIRGKTIIADYFILCSGSSERQLKAIAAGVAQELKQRYRMIPRSIEGDAATGWMLIDFADIVVHIFSPETRAYYDLESFWLEHEANILLKMQ